MNKNSEIMVARAAHLRGLGMDRPEIKKAAESIAGGLWERGNSPDQIELEIFRAFAQHGREVLRYAFECCQEWFEAADSLFGLRASL